MLKMLCRNPICGRAVLEAGGLEVLSSVCECAASSRAKSCAYAALQRLKELGTPPQAEEGEVHSKQLHAIAPSSSPVPSLGTSASPRLNSSSLAVVTDMEWTSMAPASELAHDLPAASQEQSEAAQPGMVCASEVESAARSEQLPSEVSVVSSLSRGQSLGRQAQGAAAEAVTLEEQAAIRCAWAAAGQRRSLHGHHMSIWYHESDTDADCVCVVIGILFKSLFSSLLKGPRSPASFVVTQRPAGQRPRLGAKHVGVTR